MQVGLVLFGTLGLLASQSNAANSPKNGTNGLSVPEEPKLPVPWKQLASKLEMHRKKPVPLHKNHTNNTHSQQHIERQAGVHGKEDEAKLQADTEGVVVQPVAQNVANKLDMKLASQSSTPAPKEMVRDASPSLPLNSSVDVMAELHKEAESKFHKGEKQHKTKPVQQKKTINRTHDSPQLHKQTKHTNGLANFEKDMGVNTTHPKNHNETSGKVAPSSKKLHKGKHHKGKKAHSQKSSMNTTGEDAMTALHDEVTSEDTETSVNSKVPAPTTTTTTTTSTTTTFSAVSKGLLHLREDMYMGGHQDRTTPKSNPSHHKMPGAGGSASSGVVHSAITVNRKHRQSKYDQYKFSWPKAAKPADPMAAVHQEVETIHKEESTGSKIASKPQEKPVAKAASPPLIVERPVNAGGLARLDNDLGTNATMKQPKANNASEKVEGSAPQAKHSSHTAKHHKKAKVSIPQATHSMPAANKVDPMSALHHELHPKEDAPQPIVEVASAQTVKVPQLKVHESRRNSLRKFRDDTSR
eukprot:gnl/MRDRNA2_/MRDRNA2_90036_c0_seq1.p1 gnl/MRDRNA2_/MRDRNA2_90036_c0~~gnl/MRDRNA2_/MRDRNA2_90036_c0_seq1.p1  ORF type:complete len:526 (-),score=123.24 gnl/MRDRNA2_/MRDRNA2_90036_c0_seq1:117-1694(-)